MHQSPPESTHQNRRPERIFCIYENQPLSACSTHAVPRLLAQLVGLFVRQKLAPEVITISPGGGEVKGAINLAADFNWPAKVLSRIKTSPWFTAIDPSQGPEATIPFHRTRSVLKPFRADVTERTWVVCATMSAAILARQELAKSRILYWIQGMPRLGQEAMACRAVAVADAIVAPSKALYNDLFELICRDRFAPPVWVIPNAIDTEQFQPVTSEKKAAVRASLGIDPQTSAIMHIGRAPEKGLQVAKAALAVAEINRPVVLISAGGSREIRTRIADQVEVVEIGRVPPSRLSEIYQICDVGLVPSVWWENCPLALIEMMTLGLCVIGSRVGGIPEMIDHGANGLLVDEPNDVESWASAISSVLSDGGLRQRLAAAAQRTAACSFNQQDFLSKWTRLIDTVAGLA